jgi:hypothetical protein
MGNALTFWEWLRRSDLWRGLETSLPLSAVGGLAAFWSVAWALTAAGLWFRVRHVLTALLMAWTLYLITTLGSQLLFTVGPYERGRLGGEIVIAALLTGIIGLWLTRPGMRGAFQNPESPAP